MTIMAIFAGVILTNETLEVGTNKKSTIQTEIEGSNLRTVIQSAKGGDQVVIYRGDKKLFWVLDNQKKTYTEMTEAHMLEMKKNLAAMMEKMQAQMEKQLQNIPPEKREMMKKAMGEFMPLKKGAPDGPSTTYTQKGDQEKINQWTTSHYLGKKGDQLVEEVWIANLGQLGVAPSEIQGFKDFSQFMNNLTQDLSGGSPSLFKLAFAKENEIPVKIVRYSQGKPGHTTQLVSIKKEELDPKLFELPQNYQKTDIPKLPTHQ